MNQASHRFLRNPWGKDICDAKVDEGDGRVRTCARPRMEHKPAVTWKITQLIEEAQISLGSDYRWHVAILKEGVPYMEILQSEKPDDAFVSKLAKDILERWDGIED